MFKKENQIWLYLIGILLMFGLLIMFSGNILGPALKTGNWSLLFQRTDKRPSFSLNTNANYFANLNTSKGQITINLFSKSAPQNVNNFVYLAQIGYYSNTKFHRLIPKFLVQGGDKNTLNSDPTDDGKGRPGYLIEDEINWDALDLSQEKRTELNNLGYSSTAGLETPKFQKYIVGLASAGPNTNGSQFFIVIADFSDPRISQLDGKFTPIGTVVSGFDVVDLIANISVDDPNSQTARPTEDIILQSVDIVTQ
jgi:cyclophilin family peptidyl-prolyl cis-trans isomerase